MRIARVIFVGSIAALALAATPSLAKNSNSAANANAQKVEDKPAAEGCHAYQQAPDGSWVQLACQQAGPTSQTPTPRKSATRNAGEETH
jgi:hypothetical protein